MDPLAPDMLQTGAVAAALIALGKLAEVLVTRLRSATPPEHTPQKNAERIAALEMTLHGMRESQAARYTELREWMGRLDRKLDELLVSLHRGS